MTTTATETTATYRLASSDFLNAPGLIAWARNGYRFERDRKNMLDVITGTWSSLPREAAQALLADTSDLTLDGATVVFTYTPPEPEPEIETKEYTIRIGVTVRAFAEENFEASSWEEAVEKAKAYDPNDFLYSYERDQGFEGDEIGYLKAEDDADLVGEHEIDLRTEGEPYSWTACDIVKDLAKLAGETDDPIRDQALEKLVVRARAACAKE